MIISVGDHLINTKIIDYIYCDHKNRIINICIDNKSDKFINILYNNTKEFKNNIEILIKQIIEYNEVFKNDTATN